MTVNRTQIEENQVQGNTFLQVGNNLSDVASQQTALNNITGISSNTNGYVLTNDIDNTGNAVFMPPAYASGDGGVATDTTLAGDGSSGNPLGIAEIITDTTLTGYGTINNPLGIAEIITDTTLTGYGTSGNPLGIAPLEARRYVGQSGQPAFQNGWGNWQHGQATVAFYKDPFGIVHLEGMLTGGAVNTTAFTLPSGYIPSAVRTFVTYSDGWTVALISINPNGTVVPGNGNGNTITIPLDGITFLP